VSEGASLDSWISGFRTDEARFAEQRRPHLLYSSLRKSPVVLLVTGAHESGKTTVAVKLIEALVKDGLRVGSLKHTDHEYETDAPGKDSQRHKAAGAEPAILVAGRRSAMHRQWNQIAAVCGRTLIVNLPGSPRGAVECLEAVASVLGHAVATLRGEAGDDHPGARGERR